MGRIEKSIEIKAPPEKVWEMLAFDKALEWMNEMEWESVEYISEVKTPKDKFKVGTSAHITEKHDEYDLEVTESIENEKFTTRTSSYSGVYIHILRPVEAGIKFTIVVDYRLPYSILGKLLDKLFFQRTIGKQLERSMKKLKSILEK